MYCRFQDLEFEQEQFDWSSGVFSIALRYWRILIDSFIYQLFILKVEVDNQGKSEDGMVLTTLFDFFF